MGRVEWIAAGTRTQDKESSTELAMMAAWRWPGDCASWRGRSPGAPRCERDVSGATTTAARGGSETFRDVTPGPIEQGRHEVQGRLRGGSRQQQVQIRQHEDRPQEQQGRQREGNRKRARLGPLHEEIGAVVEKFEIAPKVLRTEEKKLKFLGHEKIKHF